MGAPLRPQYPHVSECTFSFFILSPSLLVQLCLGCVVVALSSGAFRSLARAPWRRCILLWGKQGAEQKDGRGGRWGGGGQMVASREAEGSPVEPVAGIDQGAKVLWDNSVRTFVSCEGGGGGMVGIKHAALLWLLVRAALDAHRGLNRKMDFFKKLPNT